MFIEHGSETTDHKTREFLTLVIGLCLSVSSAVSCGFHLLQRVYSIITIEVLNNMYLIAL